MNRSRSMARWSFLTLLVLAICTGCSPGGGLFPPPGGGGGGGGSGGGSGGGTGGGTTGGCLGLAAPTDATHQSGFDQLNAYRQTNGLSSLAYSATLQQAADAHAKDMYDRSFFSHTDPDGGSPGDRAVAAGFCHPYGGENIAYGLNSAATVSEVMTIWKNSPGHNANMLKSDFKYVGIGYYHIRVGSDDHYYWVQLFAIEQ